MKTPDGAFGWGDPAFGRPRVTILERRRSRAPGAGEEALVEVEVGVDPGVRLRMSLPVARQDTVAIIRLVALRRALDQLGLLSEHLESLVEHIDGSDLAADRVFSGDTLAIPGLG